MQYARKTNYELKSKTSQLIELKNGDLNLILLEPLLFSKIVNKEDKNRRERGAAEDQPTHTSLSSKNKPNPFLKLSESKTAAEKMAAKQQ